MIILKLKVFVYSEPIEYILAVRTMPVMYGYFTLPCKLYKNEDEVWDHLSKINIQSLSFSPDVARLYKTWLDKLIGYTGNIHPLEFSFVRYCLKFNNANAQANLFEVERPTIICSIYARYGQQLADDFYNEISAKESYQFMSDLCSLNAEYECAKFIDGQNNCGGIKSFHPKVGNTRGAFDTTFMWKDEQWYAEAKNILHEDGNLCFISHIIAGMYWLKEEGTKLRKWKSVLLEGSQIDNDFRKQVVNILRENSNLIFAEFKANPRFEKITIDGIGITRMQQGNKQTIKISQAVQNLQRSASIKLTAKPAKWFSQQEYSISPQRSFGWAEKLSNGFRTKLTGKISEIRGKIKQHNIAADKYLGFINLELHEKYSNIKKCALLPRGWESKIKELLDHEKLPIVLHTRIPVSKSCKEIFVLNERAKEEGFESQSNKHLA